MPGKTLDELENVVWGPPKFNSHLVITCHRLRTKPIDEFTPGDLRIMIGQKIGLPHLMPRALLVLENEPLAEGDYYPGDLLANVIECDEWLHTQPDFLRRALAVAERALADLGGEESVLQIRLERFLNKHRTPT